MDLFEHSKENFRMTGRLKETVFAIEVLHSFILFRLIFDKNMIFMISTLNSMEIDIREGNLR